MEELSFLDLVILQRIEPGTVIERFGPKINSSFFEAANILGTLKQKGYIDFKSSYPGPSEVEVTGLGARMIEVADEKAKEAVDELDIAILKSIVSGHKDPDEIKEELNIRGGDLALHIHKLVKQDLASYTIKGGKISLSVTEDGFKKVGVVPKVEKAEEIVITGEAQPPEAAPPAQVKLDTWTKLNAKMEYYMESLRKNPKKAVLYLILLLLILAVAGYLLFFRMGS